VPVISTTAVSAITATTATSGGNVTSDGGASVTARGVCWSTSTGPTIANSKTIDGAGIGEFNSNITGLSKSTYYYVRAYATNSVGTSYGNEVSFKTSIILTTPTITTSAVSAITATTATGGGNVTSDGGATVTARGVCWSTASNPTTANSVSPITSGTGSFVSGLTGLTANTTYYVRAFATNSVGTAYGNEVSFKTLTTPTGITDIDGNVYTSVTIGTQTWMVENLKTTKYNDGTAIPLVTDGTAWVALATPGYCWYNNDAASNKTTYGAMYNWYAVNNAKLAPAGWHVATDAEWTTLESYVSNHLVTSSSIAKALAAKTNWASYTSTGTIGDNITLNNSSGFSALPGGYRYYDGTYDNIGYYGYWWSSTEGDTTSAWLRYLTYHNSYLYRNNITKSYGFSVRCVRDY
ncbi:MAG: fibrobacter succinogenes major paralogous domain-containing protein, partial [Paludibacter sp.]